MSKRTLALGLLVIVIGAIGYFGYGMLTESEAEKQAQTQQQQFPSGILQTTGGGTFEFASVPKDRPVVLMFFSPTCPYCQQETAEIVQHKQLPQDATILMVSTFARNALQAYVKEYNLDQFDNIRVLRDFGGSLFQKYGVEGVPYTIVYDESHRYVRAFKGKADVNRLYAAVSSPETVESAN
ncbi:peroxiredoxin family protein [Longibacter salinarum]|nr:TlpA disulfide reductase family protein [Longibacter salinarum]